MDLSAPSTTASSSIYLLGAYYDRVLLENLYPELRFYQLAKKKPMPKGMGKTITFTKITKVSASTSVLTEGVPPSPTWLTATQISDTLVQLGQYVPISDLLSMTALDPVIEDTAKELGAAASESIDKYVYARCFGDDDSECDAERTGILGAATCDWSNFYKQHPTAADQGFSTIFFSLDGSIPAIAVLKSFLTSTTAATAAEYGMTVNTVLRAVNSLRVQNVPTFDNGDYVMVVHPDCITQLMRDNDFQVWNSPQNAKETMWKGEAGRIANCRLVTSTTIGKTESCSISVGTGFSGVFNVLLGKDAIAVTEIEGAVKMKIKPAGSAGAVDPLDQVSTVGYKWTGCAKVLDEARGKVIITLTTMS